MVMKKIYTYLFLLTLFLSCSKDEGSTTTDNDPVVSKVKACFTIAKTNVLVGESIAVTNCSTGSSTYSYNLGNGETRTEEHPTIVYGKAGDYTISLTASNDLQESDTFSQKISVADATAEEFFVYPEIEAGFQVTPLRIGINPETNAFYNIVLEEDLVGPAGNKFYYLEVDENYQSTKRYLADRPFETGNAFVTFFPNKTKNFVFSRTLDGLYASQEVTYSENWGFMNGINPATKLSYGSLRLGSNYLYFGAEEDAGVYKTAIEVRNSSGDAFEVHLNSIGAADAMLGDLIETNSGYLGFGGIFSKNDTNPKISSYTPILVFFDFNFQLLNHFVYEQSVLADYISSSNDLNGTYHLTQLDNGNIAMYANGELLLVDSEGNLLISEFFENTPNIQALHGTGDSFIVTTSNAIRKYSATGNLIKSIYYPGILMPNIIEMEEKLFFMAAYEKEGVLTPFYGAMDENLNFINLN